MDDCSCLLLTTDNHQQLPSNNQKCKSIKFITFTSLQQSTSSNSQKAKES